jgi:hypothetical protein
LAAVALVWLVVAVLPVLALPFGVGAAATGVALRSGWPPIATRVAPDDPREQGRDAAFLVFLGVAWVVFGVLAVLGVDVQ